jgi:tRNA(fMet)-specific endonuclease VapC
MTYLLDSNTWIDHFRQSSPAVTIHLTRHPAANVLLCSVVLGELQFGVVRSPPVYRAINQALLEDARRQYRSISFDDMAALEYADIRADLTARGQMIGSNDLQIAAIARVNGFTLVTHNVAEFSRVPGLLIEDWQVA